MLQISSLKATEYLVLTSRAQLRPSADVFKNQAAETLIKTHTFHHPFHC